MNHFTSSNSALATVFFLFLKNIWNFHNQTIKHRHAYTQEEKKEAFTGAGSETRTEGENRATQFIISSATKPAFMLMRYLCYEVFLWILNNGSNSFYRKNHCVASIYWNQEQLFLFFVFDTNLNFFFKKCFLSWVKSFSHFSRFYKKSQDTLQTQCRRRAEWEKRQVISIRLICCYKSFNSLLFRSQVDFSQKMFFLHSIAGTRYLIGQWTVNYLDFK